MYPASRAAQVIAQKVGQKFVLPVAVCAAIYGVYNDYDLLKQDVVKVFETINERNYREIGKSITKLSFDTASAIIGLNDLLKIVAPKKFKTGPRAAQQRPTWDVPAQGAAGAVPADMYASHPKKVNKKIHEAVAKKQAKKNQKADELSKFIAQIRGSAEYQQYKSLALSHGYSEQNFEEIIRDACAMSKDRETVSQLINEIVRDARIKLSSIPNGLKKTLWLDIAHVRLYKLTFDDIKGFHIDPNNRIEQMGSIQFLNKEVLPSGFYRALLKKGDIKREKTFFPSNWTHQKMAKEVLEALSKVDYTKFEAKGGKFKIEIPFWNVKLKVIINEGTGEVISYYPIYDAWLKDSLEKRLYGNK